MRMRPSSGAALLGVGHEDLVRTAVSLLILMTTAVPFGQVGNNNKTKSEAEAKLFQSRFARIAGPNRRLADYVREQTLAYSSRRSCTNSAGDPAAAAAAAACDPQFTTPIMTVSDCGGWCRAVLSANCSAFSFQDDPEGGVVGCRIGSNKTAAPTTEAAPGATTFVKKPVSAVGWALWNATCRYDEECAGYPTMTCDDFECKCPSAVTHTPSADRKRCLIWSSLATPTGSCSETVQCNSTDLVCSSGRCACAFVNGTMSGDSCISNKATVIALTVGTVYPFKYPSSGSYGNGLDLWWCVQSPRGYVVRASSNAAWGMETCCDRVTIYDGCGVTTMKLLSTWNANMGYSLGSTASTMMIRFTTDGSVTSSGFNFQFTVA